MKRDYDRQQRARTASLLLTGIMLCAFTAGAARDPYDIELKELSRPPVRRSKEQHSPHAHGTPLLPPRTPGESSIYIVQAGDHLFLILMQRYGLSNDAAERLIPKIMRLNGIRRPRSLVVGQRLTIPLPPATATPSQSPQGLHHPTPPESAVAPPSPANATDIREIVAAHAKPCQLARAVAEQLKVRTSALSPLLDAESVSVSYHAQKIAVVCGLAPAESYTLERLLARQGVKLLRYKSEEAPRTVVEELAGSLGISFSLYDADAAAELPLTYLFPAVIDEMNLRLTIRPVTPPSKP